jgi:SAM-dependent methyltransferase
MKTFINSDTILTKAHQEQFAHPKGTKGIKAIEDMFVSNSEVIDKLLQNINKEDLKDKTIVDVGFGHSYSLLELNKLCTNCEIIGIDNSELALRIARKELALKVKKTTNKITTLYGGTPNLPIKNYIADVIILSNVIYFWSDLKENFKNIAEKLKNTGTLLLYFTDIESLKDRLDLSAEIYNLYELNQIEVICNEFSLNLINSKIITRSNGQTGYIAIFKKEI